MKKKFFLITSILSLFTISFFYANFSTFSPVDGLSDSSLFLSDEMRLSEIFDKKELFYSGKSLRCKNLGKQVVGSCCQQEAAEAGSAKTETINFQCPPPDDDIAFSIECIREADINLGLESTESGTVPAGRVCTNAINNYENECNDGNDLDGNFCPELNSELGAASTYPICEAIERYWYGSTADNTAPRSTACDPLGAPPEVTIELIPDPTTPAEFEENPDGSDTSITDESDGSGTSIDLPPDYNKYTDIFRLEIPGNFARYFARSQYAQELSRFNEFRGVDCDADNLNCEVDLTTLSMDTSGSSASKKESLITEFLTALNNNKMYIRAQNYFGPYADERNPVGTQINQFVMTDGVCPIDQFKAAANFFDDPGSFDADWLSNLGHLIGLYITIPLFGGCDIATIWNGQAYVIPVDENNEYSNKTKFNLKDDYNVRFRNVHDPKSASGYKTDTEDFYYDKAGVIAGLDDKSCNILKNAKIKIPKRFTDSGFRDDWNNRREEITEIHEKVEGKQYTFMKPYFCQCSETYTVAKTDNDGAIITDDEGNTLYEEKTDNENDDNYCIYDLAEYDNKLEAEVNLSTKIIVYYKDSFGATIQKTVNKSFGESFQLFERDNNGDLSETFAYINSVLLLESWDFVNADVSKVTGSDQELAYTFFDARKSFSNEEDAINFINALENSENIDKYISGNFPKALTDASSSLSTVSKIQEDGIGDLVGYCIENDINLNPSQKQFYTYKNPNVLYATESLNNLSLGNFNLDNNDTTKEVDVFNQKFALYGCNNVKFYNRYLKNQTHPDLTRSEADRRIPSALPGELSGKIDLGNYKLGISNFASAGGPGFVFFYMNFASQIEWLEYKPDEPLINIGRWILRVILHVLSAIVGWLSPVLTWSLGGLLGPDGFGFNLNDLYFKAQGGIILNNAHEEYKTELDVSLRRINTNIPDIKVYPINDASFEAPACEVRENWHKIKGVKDFLSFLWKTGVVCPIQAAGELTRLMFLPIRQFFWDIVPWLNGLVSNIVANLVGGLIVDHGNLRSYSDLMTMISNSFFKYPFNPNYTKSFPSNALVPAPILSSIPASLFGNLCSLGVEPELNCFIYQLMTNPTLGSAQMKACILRGGAKTHFRSLNDVKENVANFKESFDFPPVRFCNSGDAPLDIDQALYETPENEYDISGLTPYEKWYFLKNPNVFDSDVSPSLDFQLNDFAEIDQMVTSDGNKIGWQNQCALFMDLSFIGHTKFERQYGPGPNEFKDYYFELLTSRRSNYFVNDFFTCVDARACNPSQAPIERRKNLAVCSMAADIWYTVNDRNTSTFPDEPARNLLTFFASENSDDIILKNELYKVFKKVYCISSATPTDCKSDLDDSIELGFDGLRPYAKTCLDLLRDAGVNTTSFVYPKGPVSRGDDFSCERIETLNYQF